MVCYKEETSPRKVGVSCTLERTPPLPHCTATASPAVPHILPSKHCRSGFPPKHDVDALFTNPLLRVLTSYPLPKVHNRARQKTPSYRGLTIGQVMMLDTPLSAHGQMKIC
jgi:hypothetical protein